MLANNRFFGVTAATMVSGLAPAPNALPWHQALARSSGSFGRTAAVPRGYGAIGAAWPTRAGEIAADPDATLTLTALPALVLAARQVVGEATIELTAAGDVQATAVVAGTAAMTLTVAADIQAAAAVAGLAAVALGAVGNVGALADVVGSAIITLGASTTSAMGATARTAGVAYFSAAAEGSQLTESSIAAAVWSAGVRTLTSGGGAGGATAEEVAAAVRVELATELARVDAAVSSRVAAGATVPSDVRYVNGVAITGTGVEGDTWGPA